MSQYQPPSQPLPPQQWQEQPPYYPQSYQQIPQPNKKNTPWSILVAIGTMLLLGLTIGCAAQVSPAQTSPTTTPATNRIGTPVTSSIWQITINSVKTSPGTDIDKPEAGNIFLIINFTAKNTDINNQDMNPSFFMLRDLQGNTYDYIPLGDVTNPIESVTPDQQLREDVSFEVPIVTHSFILQFEPIGDRDGSQLAHWTIQDNPTQATAQPTQKPTPSFATFGDGTYQVGKDIQPGTYRTRTGSTNCYYARLKGFSGSTDDIIANNDTDAPAIVTIKPTDKGFSSQNCGTWTKDLSRITASKTSFDDGMYIVGTDITPGTYRDTGGDNCYYARLSGFGNTTDDILANNLASAPAIVTISASDKGFEAKGCGTWKKL